MITDSGTRSSELYAPVDDSLPAPAAATDRPAAEATNDAFARSREQLERIVDWLGAEAADGIEHSQLKTRLHSDGRELLRLLLQDHFDLRSGREERRERVCDEHGTDVARLSAIIAARSHRCSGR